MTNFNLPSNPVKPEVRDIHFDFSQMDRKAWHSWHPDGPHVAHWFNSLSITFPEGERFFVNSVRYYDQIAAEFPEFLSEVKSFMGQEGIHSREHEAYNASMAKAGYPIANAEKVVYIGLSIARPFPRYIQLAVTAALEHFTAIFGEQVLREDGIVCGALPNMAAMWRWHFNEEIEHKAVAFNLLRLKAKRKSIFYLVRTVSMALSTLIFLSVVTINQVALIKADRRLLDFRGWLRLPKIFLHQTRLCATYLVALFELLPARLSPKPS